VRRGATVGAAALLAVTGLTGCSRGFNAETDQIYQPGPGISVRQDGVYLLNAAFVTNGSGNATLVGALLNIQLHSDALRAITVVASDGKAATTSIGPGTISLPPHQNIQLGSSGQIRASGGLTAGTFCKVTLTFRYGAPISTQLPVLAKTKDFAGVRIGPIPSPTPVTPSGAPKS
jgi:hypothetical protein